ncbi:MAG: hypothetical protein JOZ87_00955 [Chloroflexi bacterium]|nr:hypothetical protein [Chloroflexota bacterium]
MGTVICALLEQELGRRPDPLENVDELRAERASILSHASRFSCWARSGAITEVTFLVMPDGTPMAQVQVDVERAMVMYQQPPARFSPAITRKKAAPSVDAACEAHDARGCRDAATGNTREPQSPEVAVFPWIDQAVQAGSRGR